MIPGILPRSETGLPVSEWPGGVSKPHSVSPSSEISLFMFDKSSPKVPPGGKQHLGSAVISILTRSYDQMNCFGDIADRDAKLSLEIETTRRFHERTFHDLGRTQHMCTCQKRIPAHQLLACTLATLLLGQDELQGILCKGKRLVLCEQLGDYWRFHKADERYIFGAFGGSLRPLHHRLWPSCLDRLARPSYLETGEGDQSARVSAVLQDVGFDKNDLRGAPLILT
eukprot:scaffold154915_cov21-Tisochrysis_lutea.AAC.1